MVAPEGKVAILPRYVPLFLICKLGTQAFQSAALEDAGVLEDVIPALVNKVNTPKIGKGL